MKIHILRTPPNRHVQILVDGYDALTHRTAGNHATANILYHMQDEISYFIDVGYGMVSAIAKVANTYTTTYPLIEVEARIVTHGTTINMTIAQTEEQQ